VPVGARVRWLLVGMGTENDMHSPVWHNQVRSGDLSQRCCISAPGDRNRGSMFEGIAANQPRASTCCYERRISFFPGCEAIEIGRFFGAQVVEFDNAHAAALQLYPAVTHTADMVATTPGIFQYNCDVVDHLTAGMRARLVVTE